MNKLRLLMLILAAGLFVGCGGADEPGADADTDPSPRSSQTPGSGNDSDTAGDALSTSTLVGDWELESQDGTAIRDGELVYTYRADGTGVATEGRSLKDFTWVYEPTAGTLTVLTENDDMRFIASLEGDTLTLVLEDPAMTLVMRRAGAAGSRDE